MKRLLHFLLLLVLFTPLLISCGEDETPVLRVVAGDQEISFKGANLYLAYSNNCCYNHNYYDYFISDGVLSDPSGRWTLSSYEGGTYYVGIELAKANDGAITKGEYKVRASWNEETEALDICYLYIEAKPTGIPTDNFRIDTDDEVTALAPMKVSGGFEDGEKLTLEFKGKLTLSRFNGTAWEFETVDADFYYSGKVQDIRL